MAAELQPPGSPLTNTAPPQPPPPPPPPTTTTTATKRQRRPSVRLGDIGDQPATLRASKPWRLNPHREQPISNRTSKTRPLTNLVTTTNGTTTTTHNDYSAETTNTIPNYNNNGNTSHRKLPLLSKEQQVKSKRTTTGAKRVRTTPTTTNQFEEQQQQDEEAGEERENGVADEYDDDDDHHHQQQEEGFRDFDPEASEDEHNNNNNSPVHSWDAWHRHNRSRSIRGSGVRVSDSHPDLGLIDGFPESDSRNRGSGLDDGVKNWLVGLGLGRYAPVFEIHEVDDEVLPYLTLEDLKDMGINAVGSRRKLYSAILKLRKGLS